MTPEQHREAYLQYMREMRRREPTVTVRPWYGWKNLIAVGGSDVLLIGSIGFYGNNMDDFATAMLVLGMGCRAACPAVVHWAHGHVGRGFASIAINGGLPILSGALGLAADSPELAIGGLVLGAIVAPGLDAGLLAYDDEVEVPASEVDARRAPLGIQSMAVVPVIQKNQLGLSFVGQF
jgi:hypothetical protein